MIKGNELRIGNLVKHKSGEVFKVAGSDLQILDKREDINLIQGIDISEEILLKVGFKYYSMDILRLDKGFYYIKSNNNIMKGQEILIKCIYLHQLQNLYFALTGQELNTAGL